MEPQKNCLRNSAREKMTYIIAVNIYRSLVVKTQPQVTYLLTYKKRGFRLSSTLVHLGVMRRFGVLFMVF